MRAAQFNGLNRVWIGKVTITILALLVTRTGVAQDETGSITGHIEKIVTEFAECMVLEVCFEEVIKTPRAADTPKPEKSVQQSTIVRELEGQREIEPAEKNSVQTTRSSDGFESKLETDNPLEPAYTTLEKLASDADKVSGSVPKTSEVTPRMEDQLGVDSTNLVPGGNLQETVSAEGSTPAPNGVGQAARPANTPESKIDSDEPPEEVKRSVAERTSGGGAETGNADAGLENGQNTESSVAEQEGAFDENIQGESSVSAPVERRKPGLFTVDEDAAERALERSLVLLDALLLDPGKIDIGLDFSYGVNTRLQPTFIEVTDEQSGDVSDAIGIIEEKNTTIGIIVDWRMGLPSDSQINLSFPFFTTSSDTQVRFSGSSIDSQSESDEQTGDYSVGFVKTILKERGRRPDIIASATYSGAASGPSEVTLSVNTTKRQDPLIFTASASVTESERLDGFRAGRRSRLSIGTILAASPYTSLQFSFDQTFISSSTFNGEKITGTGLEVANATIGVSSVVSRDVFFNASVAFGLTELAQDYVMSLGISRRLSR